MDRNTLKLENWFTPEEYEEDWKTDLTDGLAVALWGRGDKLGLITITELAQADGVDVLTAETALKNIVFKMQNGSPLSLFITDKNVNTERLIGR